jgi:hypothetical protein
VRRCSVGSFQVRKKLLVAVLACITIFLSKRALHEHRDGRPSAAKETRPDATAVGKPIRTAGLY